MAATQIPEKLINFNVYDANNLLMGIADVDLPPIEFMTDTIKGSGIAGEIESIVLGHLGKMSLSLNWRTITTDNLNLAAPVIHPLELRGAQQVFNNLGGTLGAQAVKVVIRAQPKKVELGKFQVGSATDTKTELEVIYMKVFIDDIERLEIDKYNYIYAVNGIDYLADVRVALGMA